MKSDRKPIWKKILGFGSAILIGAGATTGIGFGAYNIAHKTNISNDFKEGRTIQINLRLFETDPRINSVHENILTDVHGKPIPIYDSESLVKENVKKSCTYLTNLLEQKGLTNIKVSYGFSYVTNAQKIIKDSISTPVFTDSKEPVATLYASFENSEAAFGLSNVNSKTNQYINDKNVYDALSDSPNYEIEVVKSTYDGVNYKISKANGAVNPTSTGRTGTMFVDSNKAEIRNDVADSVSILDYKLLKDGKVGDFILKNGNVSKADVGITLSSVNDNDIAYFNTGGFGVDNVNYTKIEREEQSVQDGDSGSSTPESGSSATYALKDGAREETTDGGSTDGDSSKPAEIKESKKFQTTQTFIIWKNKDGLLDYLNTLITLWYFNAYANKIQPVKDSSTEKQDFLDAYFNTSDLNYNNGVDINTRKKINKVIDALSTDEKSFMAWAAFEKGRNGNDPLLWTPPLLTESDIIPAIYDFYNSSIFSPVKPTNYNDYNNDSPYGCSESVKNGWGFLDSRCHDLDNFIGKYYGGTIDFRNYNLHFQDPNDPKEPTPEEEDPIPDPFYVNSYKIDANDYGTTPERLANKWNDAIYKFPVLGVGSNDLVNNWRRTVGQLTKLNRLYPYVNNQSDNSCNSKDTPKLEQVKEKINGWGFADTAVNTWPAPSSITNKLTKCEYHVITEAFANYYFQPSVLYSQQFESPPTIANSLGGINPLYILLIVIGVILFVIGVFVSVRYRIPGFFAFILSTLVFVLSAVIYNFYGYVFSFYSLLAIAISTFISMIAPSFLFKNIEKEISEGSTLPAAIVKSTKKYWKLALDIHIMGILSSLAFLFFGQTGNINFGAMLIISIFLSFILNGIIFFVLMLFYVYVIQFDEISWFMSKKFFLKLKQTNFEQVKKIKFFNKVSFFNKWDYYVVGALSLIGLCGVIVLAVHGPFFSIDFGASNILIINNFKQFNISTNDVMDTLGITSINNYVHDNQLVIYTINNVNLDTVTTKLAELVKLHNASADSAKLTELINNINSNTLVTTLTSESAMKIVHNGLKCVGIAIGFCAVWSLFSLNIISVIPLALNQVTTLMIILGIVTLLCIPVDINIVPVFMFIFMINTVFSTAMLSSIKGSWDRKRAINTKDLALLFNNIVSKTNLNYVVIIGAILVFSILGLFSSTSLMFCFLILIFSAIYMFFFNGKILITSLYGLILLRNIFNKELKLSRSLDRKKYDYDDVNEQKIYGINC